MRADSRGALHIDRATVHIYNDVVTDCQALPRAFADVLGGEERVKNAIANLVGNAAARVLDDNHYLTLAVPGSNRDASLLSPGAPPSPAGVPAPADMTPP